MKQRPLNKPFSVLVANVCEIEKLAIINSEIERKIIENFMPGPLTIVLQKKNIVSDKLTAKKDTVGVRIPTNKIAQEILNACKEPLATSSANLSGKANKIDIKEIINELGDNVDIYINGKIDKLAQASTVIQVIDEKPSILRQGKITKEDINNVILN
ncbi:MAG TPA: L-threonylcarbamoyladenylate synthase [Clostridiaceae bacterium]|nr:L-threonylcarbamoyladenylate synthase [Clostridiaceae bacterium]